MSVLDRMRAASTGDVTLPSGMEATLKLPRIRDCIIAGGIPLPAVEKLEAKAKASNGNTPQLSTEDMVQAARFNDEIVRGTVVALEGEPVKLTVEDVGLFVEEDYNEIVAYGTRMKPLPLAEATT